MKIKYKNINVEEAEKLEEEIREDLSNEKFNEDINFKDLYDNGEEAVDYAYEANGVKLLKEVTTLPNSEERSRAIKDLEVMQRITNERVKTRNENKKLEHEMEIRDQELALREEEVKNLKKSSVLNSIVSIGGTVVSFICYGVLLGRQNRFESGESYTTNGSRNLLSNMSRIVKRS